MERWKYEPVADFDKSLGERLRRFPREPDLTIYALRSIASLVLRGWLRVYHRFQIEGKDRLPKVSSFVLVANHTSHLDTLCLLSALPLRKLHRAFPAAAEDYFFINLPRLACAAIFVNALPFARRAHIRHSLDICRELLANPGNILILFPEGTRGTRGSVGEFKAGIGLLTAGTNIPVVPCRLIGAFDAWPKGAWWPKPKAVTLRIGEPRSYASFVAGKESAARICHELRDDVMAL